MATIREEKATGNLNTNSKSAALHASFNYYSAPTPPKLDDLSIVVGTSTETSSQILPVTDLRTLPMPISSYNHETHGFQILHQEVPIDTSHASVHDPKVMTTQYCPAMISLLKKEFGIRSAAVINHTLRDIAAVDMSKFDPKNPRATGGAAAPFFISHSDYTAGGARSLLRTMSPEWADESQSAEEREEFLRLRDEIIAAEDVAMANAGLVPGNGDFLTGKGGHWEWDGIGYEGPRYAVFSIWRPWETVKRDPLAVMDSASSEFQCAVLPRTYNNRKGYVKSYYNENPILRPSVEEGDHRWCYLSEQRPEEVYAMKFYDSEALKRGDGSLKSICPHSAFQIQGTESAPPRRSCELRMWCIW